MSTFLCGDLDFVLYKAMRVKVVVVVCLFVCRRRHQSETKLVSENNIQSVHKTYITTLFICNAIIFRQARHDMCQPSPPSLVFTEYREPWEQMSHNIQWQWRQWEYFPFLLDYYLDAKDDMWWCFCGCCCGILPSLPRLVGPPLDLFYLLFDQLRISHLIY